MYSNILTITPNKGKIQLYPYFGRLPSYNLMLIDNGWYLILENITRGYGNHK